MRRLILLAFIASAALPLADVARAQEPGEGAPAGEAAGSGASETSGEAAAGETGAGSETPGTETPDVEAPDPSAPAAPETPSTPPATEEPPAPPEAVPETTAPRAAYAVRHRNGFVEAIAGGRYRMRDNRGRMIVDRPATADDYVRLRRLAGS